LRDRRVGNKEVVGYIDVDVYIKRLLSDIGEVRRSTEELTTIVVGRASVSAIVCVVVLLEEC